MHKFVQGTALALILVSATPVYAQRPSTPDKATSTVSTQTPNTASDAKGGKKACKVKVPELTTQGGIPAYKVPKVDTGDFFRRTTMTGDWGGLRTKLEDRGFDFKSSYVGEYAYNYSGGKRVGGDYAQQLAMQANIDLAKAGAAIGGKFQIALNIREGQSDSSEFVGNKYAVQEIFGAGESARLAQIDYAHDLDSGLLNIKAGYFSLGDDFMTEPLGADFQNIGISSRAAAMPTKSGWWDYPSPQLGARLRSNLAGCSYAEIGAFEENANFKLSGHGFDLSESGAKGTFFPAEIGKDVTLGKSKLAGCYKIGAFYDTGATTNPANTVVTAGGRYGTYIYMSQMVASFQAHTKRGLVLAVADTLEDEKTAQIPNQVVLLVVAQGPFAARPNDYIAFGLTSAEVNHKNDNLEYAKLLKANKVAPILQPGENDFEVGYGAQVKPWLLIHPNIQYINHPGAFAFKEIPDAWVVGLQTKIVF
jgi:porin